MPKAKAAYTRIYACSIRFIEACGLSKKSLYKVANLANLSLGGIGKVCSQKESKCVIYYLLPEFTNTSHIFVVWLVEGYHLFIE